MDNLTVKEYQLLIKAQRLSTVDNELKIHQQAYLDALATGQKKNGKPVYPSFNSFYDYNKRIKDVSADASHEAEKYKALSKIIRGCE